MALRLWRGNFLCEYGSFVPASLFRTTCRLRNHLGVMSSTHPIIIKNDSFKVFSWSWRFTHFVWKEKAQAKKPPKKCPKIISWTSYIFKYRNKSLEMEWNKKNTVPSWWSNCSLFKDSQFPENNTIFKVLKLYCKGTTMNFEWYEKQ